MKTVEEVLFPKERVRPEVTRFERLSRFIGEYNANNLCDEVGGQDMIIPLLRDKYTPFDRLFGKKLAREVREKFGGIVVYVPQQVGSGHNERNADICSRRNEGATMAALAQRFHLTERRIRQIINEGSGE